ncbi:MAG: hypothetical protein Q8O67_15760 [Deltaproteobacteria bacterium]|nr:hypothetical protein [Deltaproteobacteria bacterium]
MTLLGKKRIPWQIVGGVVGVVAAGGLALVGLKRNEPALLATIEAAVLAERAEIEACPDDGGGPVKLHLSLKQGVGTVRPVDQEHERAPDAKPSDSVVCVVDAVGVAAWPNTRNQVDVVVAVRRQPAFTVAARESTPPPNR